MENGQNVNRLQYLRVVYRMLKCKVGYETISVEEYEAKYKAQQIKYMKKKAAKFGFQLVPA